MGAGTAGYLIEQGYIVVAYRGGEGSDDSKQWLNRRTQSHIVMRDAHRDGEIVYMDDFTDDFDDYSAQMCSIKTKESNDRVEALMTKKEMKAAGIKSPDKAESLVMQFATQMPHLASELNIITPIGVTQSANYDAGLT